MSKMGQHVVNESERKFGGVPPEDQNTPCTDCHEPYWKHHGIVCPEPGTMDEPE